jgi:STIP1 family protein 1
MWKSSATVKPNEKMTKSANEYKEAGNRNFQEHKFEGTTTFASFLCIKNQYIFIDAIKYYAKAIELKSDPSYYTNRCLCYMKLKQWSHAAEDCRHALEIDNRNVKVSIFSFKCIIQIHMYSRLISFSEKCCFIKGSLKSRF